MIKGWRKDPDYYFLYLAPSAVELLNLTAKERWKIHHRTERLKAKGKLHEDKTLITGEIGEVVGFRFFTSPPSNP